MGDQRTFITFDASLSDDTIFEESGDISVPGGRNVCEVLVESMRSEDILASDIEQHEFYGWQFTARLDDNDIWILLQWIDPWLLILENRSRKSGLFRKPRELSGGSLNLIHEVLKKIPGLSNISWFTQSEFESGARAGNPAPLQ